MTRIARTALCLSLSAALACGPDLVAPRKAHAFGVVEVLIGAVVTTAVILLANESIAYYKETKQLAKIKEYFLEHPEEWCSNRPGFAADAKEIERTLAKRYGKNSWFLCKAEPVRTARKMSRKAAKAQPEMPE